VELEQREAVQPPITTMRVIQENSLRVIRTETAAT
jgi:P pilus assembly chaperone PapD